jgi:hypothetical protein
VLRVNGSAFYDAISALSPAPAEAEVSFGIKLTGEIGNVAITKVSSEGNYSVKLVWKLDEENSFQ